MNERKAGVRLCQVTFGRSRVQGWKGCRGSGAGAGGVAALAEGWAEAWRLRTHKEHSHQASDGFWALSYTLWEVAE